MKASKFNLDLLEKLAPMYLDVETSHKIIEVVFWAMEQVLVSAKKEAQGIEPVGEELWNKACSLVVQNHMMHKSLNDIMACEDQATMYMIAGGAAVMGEPALASEMMRDRDVHLVDCLLKDLLEVLPVDSIESQTAEDVVDAFKKKLK